MLLEAVVERKPGSGGAKLEIPLLTEREEFATRDAQNISYDAGGCPVYGFLGAAEAISATDFAER